MKDKLDKIEKLIEKAQDIIKLANLPGNNNESGDHRRYVGVTAKHTSKPTAAYLPRKVIGRDKDREEIISMLRDENQSSADRCFSVIGIHGIPGSGKTTLAQYVCEYEEEANHFDIVMWIHVSQNFGLDTILREMIEQATKQPCPQFKSLTALQKRLKQDLREKRFLLVLDDVEHNKDISEDDLSALEVGGAGSKILATSRTRDALLALGAVRSKCIPISKLDEHVFRELFLQYALDGAEICERDRIVLQMIGADIAKKLKGSPLAARTVGGQLRIRQDVEFWRSVRDKDFFSDAMEALRWSYQLLDEKVRRCFAYCSIFPRGHHLGRSKLINLWAAEGFISTEEVGGDYFHKLVATSFLQLERKDSSGEEYYLLHDLLQDLAETVGRSDCCRIEGGCTGQVPRDDVRHLYIKACNGATVAGNKAFEKMITENIVKLKELRTLIIDGGETGIEAKVFDDIFDSLKSLRVLIVETQSRRILQIPESIGYLKYLRYLSIEYRCRIFFPRTVTKLYHLRVLDFGEYGMLERSCSPENMSNLVNLQRVVGRSLGDFPNIGRLTLLRTLPTFRVKRDLLGYDIKQLKHLNKLQGKLVISGLQHVRSEEEAVEAKLAEKEHLKQLTLAWDDDNPSSNHDAAVLECLCPPMGLQVLEIIGYRGSYPGWMVGKHSAQLYLQKLELRQCSPLGPAPRLFECFVHLESLCLSHLSWHTLPDNMEQVRTLKVLMISHCKNMKVLPTLPQSLSRFKLSNCGHEFTRSCKQNGENWEKIQHILEKIIL